MPFVSCPECRCLFHLSVANSSEWIKERHPQHKPGEPIFELCPAWWKKSGPVAIESKKGHTPDLLPTPVSPYDCTATPDRTTDPAGL